MPKTSPSAPIDGGNEVEVAGLRRRLGGLRALAAYVSAWPLLSDHRTSDRAVGHLVLIGLGLVLLALAAVAFG
ncbi:MAG: hypothetical protein ACXIVF_08130 [Rhizobiaceae bacterium]